MTDYETRDVEGAAVSEQSAENDAGGRLTISERYRLREFSRVRDEVRFWREQFKRAQVELATLKAEKELDEFRDRTDVAWLQGKVVRQARELKRLNDAFNSRRVMADMDPRPDVDAHSVTKVEVEDQHHKISVTPPERTDR